MPPRNGNVRRTTRPAQPPSPAQASPTGPNDGPPPPRPTGRRNRRAPEVDNDITHLRKRNQGTTKTGARLIEYQDIPICSVPLEHAARPRACEWSQDGQLFLLTDETIFVMAPAAGYHPKLKPQVASQIHRSKVLDNLSTKKAGGKKERVDRPLDFFQSSIGAKDTIDAHPASTSEADQLDSNDHEGRAPGTLYENGGCWRSAAWSPSGLGPLETCLLAVIDADLDLRIIANKTASPRGPWQVHNTLDCSQGLTADQDSGQRQRALGTQVECIAWSEALHTPPKRNRNKPESRHDRGVTAFLAAGLRSGEVVVWQRSAAAYNSAEYDHTKVNPLDFKLVSRTRVGRWPVINLCWVTQDLEWDEDGAISLNLVALQPSGPRLLELSATQKAVGELVLSADQPTPWMDCPQVSILRANRLKDGALTILAATPGALRSWSPPNVVAHGSKTGKASSNVAEGSSSSGTASSWTTCRLESNVSHASSSANQDADGERDYCAPATSLHVASDGETHLVLSSGLQYFFMAKVARDADSPTVIGLPSSIAPTSIVSTVSKSNSTVDDLRKQIEQYHSVDGWSQSDSCVVAVVQSVGDASSYRTPLDRKSLLTVMLHVPVALEESTLDDPTSIAEYLYHICDSTNGARPIKAWRPFMLLYYATTGKTQEHLLCLIMQLPERELDFDKEDMKELEDPDLSRALIRGWQDTYWSLTWFLREMEVLAVPKEAIEEHRKFTTDYLLKMFTLWYSYTVNLDCVEGPNRRLLDKTIGRIYYEARTHFVFKSSSSSSTFTVGLDRKWDKLAEFLREHIYMDILNADGGGTIPEEAGRQVSRTDMMSGVVPPADPPPFGKASVTVEAQSCPACQTTSTKVNWPKGQLYPLWYQCGKAVEGYPNGHTYPRCTQTLQILHQLDVRTCTGCWAKAGSLTQGQSRDLLEAGAAGCHLCGCEWALLI